MTPSPAFQRDRLTLLSYALIASYIYFQSVLGPALPFLRQELSLSFGDAALHTSAMSLGVIVAGLVADRVVRRIGRSATLWSGGAGMVAGGALIMLGQHIVVTILGAFLIGAVGNWLINSANATLVDHHRERRAIALTESNIVASALSMAPPLLVGGLQSLGLSWRGALLLAILVFGLLALWGRTVPIPEATETKQKREDQDGKPKIGLPLIFWPFWLLTILLVAIEWTLIFWGAGFLNTVVGLPPEQASALMSSFILAMVIGRIGLSRLLLLFDSRQLLAASFGVQGLGFALFWLGQQPLLNVLGLFICGLGVSPQFPLALGLVTGVAPGLADRVTARLSFGVGLSVLVLPLVLGLLADELGLFRAFAVFIVMWLAAAILFARLAGHLPQHASA
ncbi:MAG: MFS transporter [Anaerolineae bacterium]|nr:MFS transporter [Anaerolineae bacterium]MDW8171803.1 MFS transporter [Anaerolineae bacterium]